MYDIGTLARDSFLATLQNELTLTAGQQTALRNELLTDPAGRGYVGKSDKRAHELLIADYSIDNPAPQQDVPINPSTFSETKRMVKLLQDKGTITAAEAKAFLYHPDPDWRAVLPQTPRSSVVLGDGKIPTVQEVRQARQ